MNNSKISDISPFKMFGNLYFVGSSRVSVHLIDTEEGLVMIDTGYPEMFDQIIYSIETLGFDPKNIVAIFHSHGHIDHFGTTVQMKELSGAKTYISRIDNDIVNGTYDLSWAKELGYDVLPFFDCDVLVEDGDVFTFGTTSIRCRLTPGHTSGVLSFFVNVTDGERTITAAMHGGMGFNSMSKEFLDSYGLSYDCRDKFLQGLKDLAKEKVDLVMGNHAGQNDTPGKLKRIQEGCTDITDPDEWQKLLENHKKWMLEMLEKENQQ